MFSLLVLLSQCSFNFWNVSYNLFLGMAQICYIVFFFSCFMIWKWHSYSFNFGNKNNFAGPSLKIMFCHIIADKEYHLHQQELGYVTSNSDSHISVLFMGTASLKLLKTNFDVELLVCYLIHMEWIDSELGLSNQKPPPSPSYLTNIWFFLVRKILSPLTAMIASCFVIITIILKTAVV